MPGSVTLPAGVWAKQITLTPIDDEFTEDTEVIVLTVTPSENYDILAPYAGAGIRDNDRPNQPPVASDDDYYEVTWNSTEELLHRLEVEPAGVLTNDSDMNGDPIYVTSATTPGHAAEFDWCPDGSFLYVPEVGFVGDVTFTYIVSDGMAEDSATVTIHVVDHAPIGVDDSYDVWENTLLDVPAEAGVLVNDSDPDDDRLTAELIDGPLYASTFEFHEDGSFKYKLAASPGPGFPGYDTFTYKASDGALLSELVTVTLTLLTEFGEGIGVQKATFVNDSNLSIYSDDGKTKYEQHQWLDWNADGDITDDGDHTWPILYPRTQKLRASSVTFIIDEGNQGVLQPGVSKARGQLQYGKALIEIISAAGFTLNGKEVTFTTFTPTPASPAFDKVELINMMAVSWAISGNGVGNWQEAVNPTQNQNYVTVKPAQQKLDHLYHSAVHIGTKACDSISAPVGDATVVARIWDAFKAPVGPNPPPPNVKTWQNVTLKYYGDWRVSTVHDTKDLLTGADGSCVAWARLFIDVLRGQGIEQADDFFGVVPKNMTWGDPNLGNVWTGRELILIRNWTTTIPMRPPNFFGAGYPHGLRNFVGNPAFHQVNGVWTYNWGNAPPGIPAPEVIDAEGIPGQSTTNPKATFNDHVLVKIANVLYDPSYGKHYATLAQFEQSAVQFLGLFRNGAVYMRNPSATNDDLERGLGQIGNFNYPADY